MLYKLCMPRIDANVEEGQIGQWLKAKGDRVEAGEPVVEIITDKATFQYESEHEGVLRRIYAPEKSSVPVGYVLATIGDPSEPEPEDIVSENAALLDAWQKAHAAGVEAGPARPAPGHRRKRVRATPAARRAAKEAGIDLSDLPEAASDRRLTEEDVHRYLDGKASS